MSIRLDISVLSDTSQVCNSGSEKLGDSANEAMAATFGLGDSWHGSSYDELVNYANSSLVPCACIVSGAAKTLALGLEEVRKVASRLLSRARGFQGIFNGEGVGNLSEDLTSGVLYYDDGYDYPIYSAITNARNDIDSARRELNAVNTELSKLQTIFHPIDTTYAFGELQSISNRIDEFEASYTAFKNDLENLEAASRSCEEKLDGVFDVTDVSQIYNEPNVKSNVALTWLMSLPTQLMNEQMAGVAKDLKSRGFNRANLDAGRLKEEGLDFEYNHRYEGGEVGFLTALGYVVGAHGTAFDMAELATHLADNELWRNVFKTAGTPVYNIKKGISAITLAINVVDSCVVAFDYNKSHPELPKIVRENNTCTAWEVNFAKDYLAVVPPLEPLMDSWVYDSNSAFPLKFENWASIRWDFLGGKYGM